MSPNTWRYSMDTFLGATAGNSCLACALNAVANTSLLFTLHTFPVVNNGALGCGIKHKPAFVLSQMYSQTIQTWGRQHEGVNSSQTNTVNAKASMFMEGGEQRTARK